MAQIREERGLPIRLMPQGLGWRSSSGSLAMFAVIRRRTYPQQVARERLSSYRISKMLRLVFLFLLLVCGRRFQTLNCKPDIV
jgi:hypothetical protein